MTLGIKETIWKLFGLIVNYPSSKYWSVSIQYNSLLADGKQGEEKKVAVHMTLKFQFMNLKKANK